jgi:DNA-binding cell septation regulator SpoVG
MKEFVISEIQITPIKPQGSLVAFASCVVNEALYIGDIAIHSSLTNTEGFRLVYPDKTLLSGKKLNCVYPINRESGAIISGAIIGEYKKLILKVWRKSEEGNENRLSRRT